MKRENLKWTKSLKIARKLKFCKEERKNKTTFKTKFCITNEYIYLLNCLCIFQNSFL